jgi:hypothetical protein
MSIAEKLNTILNNQEAVYDAGKQAECDSFWDIFQDNGNRTVYTNAFSYGGWTDKIYNPKHPFYPTSCNNMFGNALYLTDTKVDIDLTNPKGTQKFSLFTNASKLKTIKKLIVNETNNFIPTGASPMFLGCTALENIEFEGVIGTNISFADSTKLSKTSIENIINHLSETSTGKALTLSRTAVNNAFTTDEWEQLIKNKENWSFSLVPIEGE